MAGGSGGVPVPGLSYASVVGGWVSTSLQLCARVCGAARDFEPGHAGELLNDVILALPCMGRVRAPPGFSAHAGLKRL